MNNTKDRIRAKTTAKIKYNEKMKKYFIKPEKITRTVKLNNFVNTVAEIYSVKPDIAKNLITDNEVTVNGDLQSDINYILKINDIVMVSEGHIIRNTNFAAKIV